MQYDETYSPYAGGILAAEAKADVRASFITQTYLHLVGAIGMFALLEVLLFNLPITERLVQTMLIGRYSWLVVLGLFMVVSWIANSWASSATSIGMQYAGLGLYVVAEAVIFLPILWIARGINPDIIPTAGFTTLILAGVLTGVMFVTRADLSWMRRVLMFAGFAAFGAIVCAIVFNFQLGPIFTYAMIAFACGYILYDTSNVIHRYRVGQHVAAALALFASVALLFWYILRLYMNRD